ncbi:MAG: hypothetical protein Kow00108_15540 [Calditrichia bacterium]
MNKFNGIFIFLILMAGICFSCRGNPDKNRVDFESIRQELESGKPISREEPFSIRNFVPYLQQRWIGFAVSYGCYRRGQAPGVKGPSEREILEDLRIVSRYWNMIRVYGSDEDSERILKVIRQYSIPVKVMLGVWLENETDHPEHKPANIKQVMKAIQLGNQYSDIICAVNVGNETQVFWSFHRMNMDNLIRYVRAVRNHVPVPVTVADDYNFWNKPESKRVTPEIDFIVTHIYPLWNGKTLDEAIPWMDKTVREIQSLHPGKTIVLGETGWATTYNPDKKGPGEQGSLIKGEVSFRAQERFLLKLHQWVYKHKIPTFLFEAFDEPWKGGGDLSGPTEIEKHWGVFFEDRTPKPSFKNYLKKIRQFSESEREEL